MTDFQMLIFGHYEMKSVKSVELTPGLLNEPDKVRMELAEI